MKKVLVLVLSLLLLVSLFPVVSLAEDYSAKTTEELQAAIDAMRNELLTREPGFGENYVLYDENDIQIVLTGTYSVRAHSFDKDVVVVNFDAILINNSDKALHVDFVDCYVNGWSATASSELGYVKAGKKAKGSIRVNTSAVTEKGIDKELEEIEFSFCFLDPENYSKISETIEKTVRFPFK